MELAPTQRSVISLTFYCVRLTPNENSLIVKRVAVLHLLLVLLMMMLLLQIKEKW